MGAFHQVPPLLDIGVEEFPEIRLIVLEQRDPGLAQVRARVGLLEYALDVARDLRAERGIDRRGSEESLPQRRLIAGQPLLGDGGNVWSRGIADLARDAERSGASRFLQ